MIVLSDYQVRNYLLQILGFTDLCILSFETKAVGLEYVCILYSKARDSGQWGIYLSQRWYRYQVIVNIGDQGRGLTSFDGGGPWKFGGALQDQIYLNLRHRCFNSQRGSWKIIAQSSWEKFLNHKYTVFRIESELTWSFILGQLHSNCLIFTLHNLQVPHQWGNYNSLLVPVVPSYLFIASLSLF